MALEVHAPVDTACFGAYPISFVSRAIQAGQKYLNHASQTAALIALEHYYLHTSSEGRATREPADYLPFQIKDDRESIFDIFTAKEKEGIQKFMDNFAIGPKVHSILVAAGWP